MRTPLVVVSGALANKPGNGGNARMVLNWLEGLERLGVDVFFIEQLASSACVDEATHPTVASRSVNRTYLERVMQAHGFADRMALLCDADDALQQTTICGATVPELWDVADQAELLINISGHLSAVALKERFRRKAYVDLDPGFTQLWHASGSGAARLEGHHTYFTVGQRVGSPEFAVSTSGIDWLPVRQPVVLRQPAPSTAESARRFTTIASWRGAYSPIAYGDTTFSVKAHEFRKIVDLPRMSGQAFEVALDIHPGDHQDLSRLRTSGWQVVDPRHVAESPDDYCRYIDQSAAECSAAQGIYVQTSSGWFSDRTAQYLAAGKPVLVQNTRFLAPAPGDGVLVFDTVEQAARGADRIARDYEGQCEAARWLAEQYFDSSRELTRLLYCAGLS